MEDMDEKIAEVIGVEYPLLIQSELPYYRAIYKAGIREAQGGIWDKVMGAKKSGFDEGVSEGRREVVECEELVGWYDTSCGKRVFCIPEDYRNGKLKEWSKR